MKEFVKTGKPIPDIVVEKKIMTKAEVKKILDPSKLTKPGIAKKN